jgi:hypothetical protein
MRNFEAFDVLVFLFLMLWVATCSFNRCQVRDCMIKCQRQISECEKVCNP